MNLPGAVVTLPTLTEKVKRKEGGRAPPLSSLSLSSSSSSLSWEMDLIDRLNK